MRGPSQWLRRGTTTLSGRYVGVDKTCSVEGCEKPGKLVTGKNREFGWRRSRCAMHEKWVESEKNRKPCGVPGCGRMRTQARAWCRAHVEHPEVREAELRSYDAARAVQQAQARAEGQTRYLAHHLTGVEFREVEGEVGITVNGLGFIVDVGLPDQAQAVALRAAWNRAQARAQRYATERAGGKLPEVAG